MNSNKKNAELKYEVEQLKINIRTIVKKYN
jgi:hypothetical protein